MRALTVIQPFAELIAAGVKRVENRTWGTGYRGLLAIHAGKALKYGADRVEDMARDWFDLDPAQLAFGAVVAVAELVDCVQLVGDGITPEWAKRKHPWLDTHEHREGPVCWVLANVRRLAVPIPVTGERGLWGWKPPGPLVFAADELRIAVPPPAVTQPRPDAATPFDLFSGPEAARA